MTNRLAFALVTLVGASTASADTKSWAALKNNIPSTANIVVGVDVKAARASSAYSGIVATAMDAAGDAKMGFELIKSMCSIDVTTAVTDVTFAISTTNKKDGVVAIGLDGLDEGKLVDCAGKMLKMGKGSISSSKDGKAMKYVMDDGKSKTTFYAAWPAKDVVVFGLDAEKRDKLDGYLNGKAAAGDLSGYLGKAKTGGTLMWVAAAINEDHFKGGYGSVSLAKGMFTGTARLTADSSSEATKATKEATKGFGEIADQVAKKSADLAKALRAVKVANSGNDVTIDGSVAESDVPAMFKALTGL